MKLKFLIWNLSLLNLKKHFQSMHSIISMLVVFVAEQMDFHLFLLIVVEIASHHQ